MNKIAQNSALDIVSAAMEKTGCIGSPIGIEVNLADSHHRDHLNFLMTVAEMGIQEGTKRTADDAQPEIQPKKQTHPTSMSEQGGLLWMMATDKYDVRESGTTTRIATAWALLAMMHPGNVIETRDTYNKDVAHSHVAELACKILQTLGVPYRRVDNRSFVVTIEPTKN